MHSDLPLSKKAAGAMAFLATLGVTQTSSFIAGAQPAPAGSFVGTIPMLTAEEDAAIASFDLAFGSVDAAAFAYLWGLDDPIDAKIKAGGLINDLALLPELADTDYFLGNDWNYIDALALSWEWTGIVADADAAKAKAGNLIREGFALPTLDDIDYFRGAGYSTSDAVTLGTLWETDQLTAKANAGAKLRNGIELPFNSTTEELFKDPVATVVAPASADRFGTPARVTFECTDDVALDTCVATIDGKPYTSGELIPTSSLAPTKIFVTATDAAGKVTVEEITVTKDWTVQGTYAGASGTEATIVRFYIATFGRLPDAGGFGFWNKKLADDPTSLPEVASFFTTSPEFNTLYGESTTDEQFLDAIYTNVLGRQPEASGRAFWAGALADKSHTRASAMEFFAQSPELKTLTKTS